MVPLSALAARLTRRSLDGAASHAAGRAPVSALRATSISVRLVLARSGAQRAAAVGRRRGRCAKRGAATPHTPRVAAPRTWWQAARDGVGGQPEVLERGRAPDRHGAGQRVASELQLPQRGHCRPVGGHRARQAAGPADERPELSHARRPLAGRRAGRPAVTPRIRQRALHSATQQQRWRASGRRRACRQAAYAAPAAAPTGRCRTGRGSPAWRGCATAPAAAR